MAFDQGHALLIGVGSHKFAPKLNVPATVVDVQSVAKVLGDPAYCGYPPDQIKILNDEKATKQGILDALDEIAARVQEDDTVFIFYSGHGDYDKDGVYYLVSHDARIESKKVVSGTGVDQAILMEKLKNIKTNRVLMLFNACHSGEISPSLSVNEALGAQAVPSVTANALLTTGNGRIVITASKEDQVAYVGTGDLTLFAQALFNGLRGVGGVVPRGGYISAFDLYMAMYMAVKDQSKGHQEPELTVLKGVGPFAVSLFRGSSGGDLSVAEEVEDPPGAVRRVEEDTARWMAKRIGVQIGSIQDVSDSQINIAGRDVIQDVDTGGGAYIAGGVKLEGGDFVGRDKVVGGDEVHGDKVGGDKISVGNFSGSSGVAIGRGAQASVSHGLSGDEIDRIFATLFQVLRETLPAARAEAMQQAESLVEETKKGDQANDGLMATLVNGLAELAPGAVGALVSAFKQPVLAEVTGPVTKTMLKALDI